MRLALALLLASGCAHAPLRLSAPEQPLALKLSVVPRSGFAPLYVQASVRAIDDRRVLECPQFSLTWSLADEPPELSSFPGDACWADGPRVHAPRPRLLKLRYPGEWVISAAMADRGVALSARETVTVIGRTEE